MPPRSDDGPQWVIYYDENHLIFATGRVIDSLHLKITAG